MTTGLERPDPILETEVVVVGGGFAGVAAACGAAAQGRRVCLIERRTYLGAERAALLRPWLTPGQHQALKEIFGWEGTFVRPLGPEEAEWPLVPDLLKLALEDRLLAAGVRLLYAARPVGLKVGDRICLQVAGKFGTGELLCGRVIDATEQAVVARRWGRSNRRSAFGPMRLWRTLEVIGADPELAPGELAVPAGLAPACRVHRGYRADEGHFLLEHAVEVEAGGEPVTWQEEQEVTARFATARLASWLVDHHPAFRGARVVGSSPELGVPPLWRAEPASPRLAVAGGCAHRLADGEAVELVEDPAALARFGWEVGAGKTRAAGSHPAGAPEPEAAAGPWRAVTRDVDVLVVGGGTSGAGAAIAAARCGAATVLAEMNPGLGGTGTLGGVNGYWFGRRGGWNAELSRRLAERYRWPGAGGGRWNVEAKMLALLEAAREAGVQLLLDTALVRVTGEGGRVTGAWVATPEGNVLIRAGVTVDATGDGDVAVAAGAQAVYGSDREGVTMWYALTPHREPGRARNTFASTVDVGDPWDYTRAILSGRRRFVGHDHAPYLAPRESRHIVGDVRLALTDILTLRRWPDVVNIHFSNHDIKGQNTSDWLRMGLIPPNLEVEIPYRALLPQGVEGLLVTGKAISATHDALPPIRMQADLENLGFACGVAAAMAAARNLSPRELPVTELQEALVRAGILPAELLGRPLGEPRPPTPDEMQGWIAALDDGEKLHLCGEMEMDQCRREPIPIVMACTAGSEIIPLLREELARPGSPRRLQVARVLAWYGDRAAAPVLIAEIHRRLEAAGSVVPARVDRIRYTQASPDHGAMPEACYLLHSLAMCRDERAIPLLMRVAERLEPTRERFEQQESGLFHYVDALCDVAERLGDPRCLPALKRVHGYDLFHGKVSRTPIQPDFFEERLAYLEVTLGRAMARCGDREGVKLLIDYLRDARRPLARHAWNELRAISGLELPLDPETWTAWAESLTTLPCRPWEGREP